MSCKVSFRNLPFFTFLNLCLVGSLFSASACDAQNSDESISIAVLTNASSPKSDKALACKKLAVVGSVDCVDELAPLLNDPELTSWARIALEAIEAPEAEAALLASTSRLSGLPLVGVVNSLGVKRSQKSVPALSELLENEDVAVAQAAALSLGKIAGSSATRALQERALAQDRGAVRSAAAEGLVRCAEASLERGDRSAAVAIYDLILKTELPKQRLVEATRGAILSRGVAGVDLLLSSLDSDDVRFRGIALKAARQLDADGAIEALIAVMDRVPDSQRALYLLALGDRGEQKLVPTLKSIVEDQSNPQSDSGIKLAAIQLMQRLGGVDCLESLTAAGLSADPPIAQAAINALAKIADSDLDQAIESRLGDSTGQEKRLMIRLVGERRIPAIDALLDAVDQANSETRLAALASLGNVATIAEVPVLIDRATRGEANEETKVALEALRSACVRIPDQAACAQKLSEAMSKSSRPAQIVILETLAGMGGPDALKVLGDVATNGDVQLQNVATRLLGNWMSVDAGPVLMNVAKQPRHAYRVRALRAYLRLVRQFVMDQGQRDQMAKAATMVATRDAEKALILDAARRYPSEEMLRIAVQFGGQPSMKDQAQAAVLAIAGKVKNSPGVIRLIEQIKLPTAKLEIVKATYGAQQKSKDVTNALRSQTKNSPLISLGGLGYKQFFGGDPAPGMPKTLTIQYTFDGQPAKIVFDENNVVALPKP